VSQQSSRPGRSVNLFNGLERKIVVAGRSCLESAKRGVGSRPAAAGGEVKHRRSQMPELGVVLAVLTSLRPFHV